MAVYICFITAPDLKTARRLTLKLLKSKLAACVNITKIESHFIWKNKIEHCPEFLLIAKTTHSKFNALKRAVKKAHPYEVPEIIGWPVASGNTLYLTWVQKTVDG